MSIKVELQKIGILGLQLLGHFLHFIVSFCYFVLGIATTLESYLISSGLLSKYNDLNVDKVQYITIVVESDEASDTLKVIELLQWIASMGIKNVCLYDVEGRLKKSKEIILKKVNNASIFQETDETLQLEQKGITLEFTSISDGKEAVAKAANFLFTNKWKNTNLSGDQKQLFSESQMAEALKAVGCGGPDPDLLLVYGPARCHLGFPAWRIRYTEIIHMGSLKSMKYGSLVKAIYKFTMVRQRYEFQGKIPEKQENNLQAETPNPCLFVLPLFCYGHFAFRSLRNPADFDTIFHAFNLAWFSPCNSIGLSHPDLLLVTF